MQEEGRFATLDRLRGLAAILVMFHHAGTQPPLAMGGGFACVFLLLPALLWLDTLWEVPHGRLAEALGDLSYRLYCIHAPPVWAGKKWALDMGMLFTPMVAAAWALDRWVDRPVRLKLTALVKRRRLAPATLS